MGLRLAVAGMGVRGRQWVEAVRAAGTHELVACVDVDPDALRSAATALGIPADRCYVGLEEALADRDPQAVIIATSIDRHVEPCETALSRGLGVLVEKPFALSLRDARRLVVVAREAGAPIVVGQSYRYARTTQAVRRLLRDGVLGRVGMVVCQAYRSPRELSPALATLPHSALWETGVHYIDALRYLLAQEVVGVMTQSFALPWSRFRPGGSVQALLEFEGGVCVSFCGTYDSSGHEWFNRSQEVYLRVVGERATLHLFQHWIVLWEGGRYPRWVRRGPRPNPEAAHLLPQLERAVLTGVEPECSGQDNVKTVAVVEACARSAMEARRVNPQELLDEPL